MRSDLYGLKQPHSNQIQHQTLENMCRGTTVIYRCCGDARTFYDWEGRCPQAEIDLYPFHRIMGRTIRRRCCDTCRIRLQVEAEQESREFPGQCERAKAVLEFLRGDRPSPLTDAQLSTRGQQQVHAARESTVERSEFYTAHSEPEQVMQFTMATTDDPQEPNMRGLDNRETPASFFEWSSRGDVPVAGANFYIIEAALAQDINSYLHYLLGFEDPDYHFRFFTRVLSLLQEDTWNVEFEPPGNLSSFSSFLHTADPPIVDEFGSMQQSVIRYAEYLSREGAIIHHQRFMSSRIILLGQIRQELNSLTLTDTPLITFQGGFNAGSTEEGTYDRLLTFREWVSVNNASFEPDPRSEAQLQLDLDGYEHSYLGLRGSAAALLDFRDLRHQIRTNDIRHFHFHPHTEDLESFGEWISRSPNEDLSWDQAVEAYPMYLRQREHPALAEAFEEARSQRAHAARREFEGLRGVEEELRPQIFPNPTAASESYLSCELARVSSQLTSQLTQAITVGRILRQEGIEALLVIGRLIHFHRTSISTNHPLILGEWQFVQHELDRIEALITATVPETNPQPGTISTTPEGSHPDGLIFDARHLRFVADAEDPPLSSSEEDWQIFGVGIDALRDSGLNTNVNNQSLLPM